MEAAADKADDEQFLQADMKLHQTIWKLSRREQLFQTLNSVMNPFIFMVARAFSSREPVANRYADHENYVEAILNTPIPRVERIVEQYFQRLHDRLFEQESPLFLGSDTSWLKDESSIVD
jgi:DNA-binding GntR family transcriptional regulator